MNGDFWRKQTFQSPITNDRFWVGSSRPFLGHYRRSCWAWECRLPPRADIAASTRATWSNSLGWAGCGLTASGRFNAKADVLAFLRRGAKTQLYASMRILALGETPRGPFRLSAFLSCDGRDALRVGKFATSSAKVVSWDRVASEAGHRMMIFSRLPNGGAKRANSGGR